MGLVLVLISVSMESAKLVLTPVTTSLPLLKSKLIKKPGDYSEWMNEVAKLMSLIKLKS